MAELKPCPFCGSTRVYVLNALEEQPEMALVGLTKDNWNVVCSDCYGSCGTRRTYSEAVQAWNRRSVKANYGWCVIINHICDTNELCAECHYLTDEEKEWIKHNGTAL